MLDNIDPLVVAVCTIAFFLGGLLKGVIGLGLPLVAIPLVATMIPVATAIPLMVAPGYVMNIIQMRQTWHARMPLKSWWPLFVGMAVGVVAGVQLVTSAPENLMRAVLGITVVAFVLLSLARIDLPARHARNPGFGLGMGGATGLFGGLTGVFGPTLAMYFLARHLEKDRFVWIMAVVMFTGVLFLGGTLAAVGSFSEEQLIGTIAVLVPSWLGLSAGALIRKRVSQERFRNIALAALLVMGVSLIMGSLGISV